jgi:hypothetical protein
VWQIALLTLKLFQVYEILLLFSFRKMSHYFLLLTQKEKNGCHQDDEKEGCTFHVARGVTSFVA